MKKILKGKVFMIFILALAGVIAFTYLSGAHKNKVNTEIYDPVEVGEADGRTVIPFKDYNRIEVYDGKKGIFIAGTEDYKKGNCSYNVINSQGDTIQSFKELGMLVNVTKKKLTFIQPPSNEDELYGSTNLVTLGENIADEYDVKEYEFAEINKETGDILIEETNKFKVIDENNNIIYTLSKKGLSGKDNRHGCYMVRFAGNKEYIKAVNKDDTCSLINYKTKEEVYKTKPGDEIIDRACDKWVVYTYRDDHLAEHHFINDDFKPAFNGIRTNGYITDGKYIAFAEMNASGFAQAGTKVYYSDESEFDCSQYGNDIRGFAEGIVYIGNGSDGVKAVKLEEPDKGKVLREVNEMCLMDFDDDMAACCNIDPRCYEYTLLDKNEDNSWSYNWKIVDENYKPLTNDKFNYARETSNGYAVVGILKGDIQCLGVIDFNKGRGEN